MKMAVVVAVGVEGSVDFEESRLQGPWWQHWGE